MAPETFRDGIRPNPLGDWPEIDPTAFVDPSAQIMGNVHIGPRVYVGPQTVIRADEVGSDGKVKPVIVEEDSYIQDGVIIHSRGGSSVRVGRHSNIAHGVIIHGPADIGRRCFIALRASIYASTLEDECWIGLGAVVMRATVPSHTMVPANATIRSKSDIRGYRFTNVKEQEYFDSVIEASAKLRDGYLKLYADGLPTRPTSAKD
jgi:carbonic anhydrase/acetyltransferase-like protein (isoleucine patch superfamily)